MTRPAGVHWLRENHAERSPHRVLFVDTETVQLPGSSEARQILQLWSAKLVRRHGIEAALPRFEWFRGETADELAELIAGLTNRTASLYAMTHNLNFDLAVTELPVKLAARGYRLTEGALTTDEPWFRMARGEKRLTVTDSWSWLPTSVAAIGELIGRRKPPLPPDDAPLAERWARCDADTEIIADAITALMDWWDSEQLGNWSLTGPATGWSSYRHMKPGPRVLVDPDPAARAFEMRAVTGGRRLTTRLGRLPRGMYAELDIQTAHLQAMRSCKLPARRGRAFDRLPLDSSLLRSATLDILAECEVDTATPRYPWQSGSGIFYPVGRFRTVLAGPEIREAARRGELREIGAGYIYTVFDHMAQWASWCMGLLDPARADVPPVVRLAAKYWSRAVPGKWAGHTSEVVSKQPDPRPGWLVEHGWIAESHTRADELLIAGERWLIRRDVPSDDSFPAVLAFIQSYTRLALNALLDACGPAVITANTDGTIVDVNRLPAGRTEYAPEAGSSAADLRRWLDWRARDLSEITAPFVVRVKDTAARAEVISPQHVIFGADRKLSGVPRSALRGPDGRYRFETWPKLHVQIAGQHSASYVTQTATVDLSHIPPAGWLLTDGRVAPPECAVFTTALDTDPLTAVLPARRADLAPIERQHAVLRRVLATEARSQPRSEEIA